MSDPTNGLMCTEAGDTAVFSLALTSEPASFVTVGVNSSDTTEGSLGNVSAITFTSNDWSIAQTVTVTGVHDNLIDGNITYYILVAATTSGDTNYHGVVGKYVNVTTQDSKF